MGHDANVVIDKQAVAHGAAEAGDVVWLRALSMRQRGDLIESACEAAAEIYRSRIAAGLPAAQRAPWPASTWDFFKRRASRARC